MLSPTNEKTSYEQLLSSTSTSTLLSGEREREREREIGRGPREQYRSVPRGGVKKEKREKK